MAIGPRLEFRQTQSLVMTPQLRQAIKLLQCTNMEAVALVEQELERNPLLERDEHPDAAGSEQPALDQRPDAAPERLDTAEAIDRVSLPDMDFDPGNLYDGAAYEPAYAGRGGSFDMDGEGGFEERAESRPSLREHLGEQLRLAFDAPEDRLVGAYFIAILDPAGRASAGDAEIAAALGLPAERVAAVRARMMRFEPTGVFARDLRECLATQLAEMNRFDPAMAALLDNLELLAQRDMRALMQVCGVDMADLAEMVAELRRLNPKPAAGWDANPLVPVIPDVLLRALPDGTWHLELNPETAPRLIVNQALYARVNPRAAREEKAFLSEQLASANWLVKSLQQRAGTILKVAAEVVRQQDGFLRQGAGHLRPLILRDVAAVVEMHESTISRVTANKYLATPRGVFELKYFFTTALGSTEGGESHSAETVRHRIRALIGAETADSILSDDAIVLALRREGVDIARRTVAKYREALRIPSSVQRKREKALPA
jgi:RNA polymerase sigma-54 factor